MDKQQLEQLSDFDINIEMCKSLNIQHKEGLDVVFAAGKSTGNNVTAVMGVVDYCNNWSDMGPLMLSSGIGTEPVTEMIVPDCPLLTGEWTAENATLPIHYIEHKNPLRAAAIVYLLMQEGV